jgi:hypothetical protein
MNHARTISSSILHEARSTGVSSLIAGIESSSILVPRDAARPADAGSCFDAVDIEILEWIAAHGRGKRRRSGWLM